MDALGAGNQQRKINETKAGSLKRLVSFRPQFQCVPRDEIAPPFPCGLQYILDPDSQFPPSPQTQSMGASNFLPSSWAQSPIPEQLDQFWSC